MNGSDGLLADLIGRHFQDYGQISPVRIGVAVSGGGDSVALLCLLADWARGPGHDIRAVTVDHGLRAASAAEAAGVAALCAGMGIAHTTLQWRWDGTGNLPDRARRGRMALIGDWAAGQGIGDVALGHTADDQAETFLMRLARGSGVDGLAGMAAERQAMGVTWHRPLLAARRADLRACLSGRGIGWIEDPTNDDPGYDRVKARHVLGLLNPLGLTVGRLVETAGRMALAREVLETAALDFARREVQIQSGDLLIGRDGLQAAARDTRLRVLAAGIRWIASADYRPRWSALVSAWDAVMEGRAHALAGCLLMPGRDHLRMTREFAAVRQVTAPTRYIWDGRWALTGPHDPDLVVRATGEDGLAQCPDWRASGLPRRSAVATPSVWDGTRLVAAPLAGRADGWQAALAPDRADFLECLNMH